MRLSLFSALVLSAPPCAEAQLPVDSLRLIPGIGVDTTRQPNRQLWALWRRYLTTGSDSARAALWSPSERARWPLYDFLAPAVYNGYSHFTVVDLGPAPGLKSTYRIRTLISSVDASGHVADPVTMYQVYAVREDGRWVLANALPRLTRSWPHRTLGTVTFVYPPGHSFVRATAAASSRFVDSLVLAFGLPKPAPIMYYFTDDLQLTLQALGLDFYPFAADTIGGRSNAFNRQVFIGLPGQGEAYRHELAHIILQPLVSARTAPLVMEGLMTWVGGRAAVTFTGLLPALDGYLRGHPHLSLQTILTTQPSRDGRVDPGYDGLAVLCRMVYDEGGVPAIRGLLGSGPDPDHILDFVTALLAISRPALETRWRSTVARLANR